MRLILFAAAVTLCCSCGAQFPPNPPPTDRFYWPTGLAYVPDPLDANGGVLYAVNANFDRRFDNGDLLAVDLGRVGPQQEGLPPLQPTATQVKNILTLNTTAANSEVIESFGADSLVFRRLASGALRFIVPTRAENSRVSFIDAAANGAPLTQLSCVIPSADDRDCISRSPSLIENQNSSDQNKSGYRAPEPISAGIAQDTGEFFITHAALADAPYGSARNYNGYLVHVGADGGSASGGPTLDNVAPDADDHLFHITDPSEFVSVGQDGTDHVAVGKRYAYVTGRYVSPNGYLVRLVDRENLVATQFPTVEANFRSLESRGLALTADSSGNENRMYLVGRAPDYLIVLGIQNPTSDAPTLVPERAVPLPSGSTEVVLVPRPGHGPLALITSTNIIANVTGSQNNLGKLTVYDDDVGELVGEVPNLGTQPVGLAYQPMGAGVRIFVSVFGDGRIAVIDMPDVTQPQNLHLIAYLGTPHVCLVDDTDPTCTEAP